MSGSEGSSSSTLFSIAACRAVNLPLGIPKPKSQSLFLLNISAMTPADLSFLTLFVKGALLPL